MAPTSSALDCAIDTSTANVTRVYDCILGGKDNYKADRVVAKKLLDAFPSVRAIAQENRRFLGRAVRWAASEYGIRRFLDLGTGLPTGGQIHEVLQQRKLDDCSVLYVDQDPVVQTHAIALTRQCPAVECLAADLRRPDEVLDSAAARTLLEHGEPIALVMCAVLHFVPDEDDPAGLVGEYMDRLPPGSILVYTHVTDENPAAVAVAKDAYKDANYQVYPRSKEAIEALATGNKLIVQGPGIEKVTKWNPNGEELDPPEEPDEQIWLVGGAAAKPLVSPRPSK
ncbi:SAM-dependent methyltransferase [Actinoallomurus sp. NPDC052274]|uniref:SAM-dependent methyltransferase n=1 Tax=Actinoallomurus sp. NPDC052274 TaxID=3155420 RepID=UPI00342CEEA3